MVACTFSTRKHHGLHSKREYESVFRFFQIPRKTGLSIKKTLPDKKAHYQHRLQYSDHTLLRILRFDIRNTVDDIRVLENLAVQIHYRLYKTGVSHAPAKVVVRAVNWPQSRLEKLLTFFLFALK